MLKMTKNNILYQTQVHSEEEDMSFPDRNHIWKERGQNLAQNTAHLRSVQVHLGSGSGAGSVLKCHLVCVEVRVLFAEFGVVAVVVVVVYFGTSGALNEWNRETQRDK